MNLKKLATVTAVAISLTTASGSLLANDLDPVRDTPMLTTALEEMVTGICEQDIDLIYKHYSRIPSQIDDMHLSMGANCRERGGLDRVHVRFQPDRKHMYAVTGSAFLDADVIFNDGTQESFSLAISNRPRGLRMGKYNW